MGDDFIEETDLQLQCYDACINNDIHTVIELLPYIDPNKIYNETDTLLVISCQNRCYDVVKVLFDDDRTDLNLCVYNRIEEPPLHILCGNHFDNLLSDLTVSDPLRLSEESIECNNLIKLFVNDHRIDLNTTNCVDETAFMILCNEGNTSMVKLFLDNNLVRDINESSRRGHTALIGVCCYGHIDIFKMFMEDPTLDLTKSNYYIETPFYFACRGGYIEIVKILLEYPEVDTNSITTYGRTPFFVACENGHLNIVKILLENNYVDDINKIDIYGITPFHIACMNRHFDIIKFLLENNGDEIDLNTKESRNSMTPFGFVCQQGFDEIIEYMAKNCDTKEIEEYRLKKIDS